MVEESFEWNDRGVAVSKIKRIAWKKLLGGISISEYISTLIYQGKTRQYILDSLVSVLASPIGQKMLEVKEISKEKAMDNLLITMSSRITENKTMHKSERKVKGGAV